MSIDTRRLLSRCTISVRWRDLDTYNHVNNSVFLSYLEEARLIWLRSLQGEWKSKTSAPVIASSQLDFRKQLEWPGEVAVETWVERIGNRSLTLGSRIESNGGETVYCDARVVLVWINPSSATSIPLPAVIREACA
ncbi:MAG: acyl-CoA thioesterase [Gammaproteobacteria bacterium]|nr:MAG: acyl-CoA thioesterase [Gammaproteobacteria bacterium]